MKREILSNTDLLVLPELTLFIFLAIFVGALVWMYRPGSREFYDRRGRMPLEDDTADLST